MLDKTFDPETAEQRLYRAWEKSGAFAPHGEDTSFSIVMPPPNVTGSLHVGHALNCTLQDVLTRFHRMRGEATLWLPGTDHAGIATQMVVERKLAAEGSVSRLDMGRKSFVDRVWAWKAESGGTITRQLRRLGASCDWSRERFTLDEGLSAAVRKVFVALHEQGLIYRDKRLVNWHPELQTAVSDLEVENVEIDGHMWRLRYPIVGGEGSYIVVATTRPETMLGDTAVAVNPADERYRHLVGKQVRLPLADRLIPIIADSYADPEKGTGAVKITPAHDFNDFQVGKRHALPSINILTPEGRLNEETPGRYRGLQRFEARERIVADMQALGLLDGIESHRLMVPFDEKSKSVVIEPYLTDQWFVDAAMLAKPAIAAVEGGRTTIQPKNWEKTYFEWMRNIEPWCISRQLWWGHRIPAWYGPDGKIFVAENEADAEAAAKLHYGNERPLTQDEDVLDTWFSSALWPFSTLGWPEENSDLKRFYPTNTLITAGDIIFFWVARMMMLGLHFMGEVPFRHVFFNPLVLDEKGQKMSKVKGNVVDPLELIDTYGADAVRFTMVAISGQGRHTRLSRKRVEGYRNFGTKLWNAARFAQMNGCARTEGFDPATCKVALNRWIVGETARVVDMVTRSLSDCEFDEAANGLYRFVWNHFCDWYVELAKPILNESDEAAKSETRATTAWVLDVVLKVLHPFMPFLTEELWAHSAELGSMRDHTGFVMTARWPQLPDSLVDPEAHAEIGLVIDTISEGRSVRQEMNVPPSARPPLLVLAASERHGQILQANASLIGQLLRVSEIRFGKTAPDGSIPYVVAGVTLALPVAEFIDLAAERARLVNEINRLGSEMQKLSGKLGNPDFVARAPEEVVEENKKRLATAEAAHTRLKVVLGRIGQ